MIARRKRDPPAHKRPESRRRSFNLIFTWRKERQVVVTACVRLRRRLHAGAHFRRGHICGGNRGPRSIQHRAARRSLALLAKFAEARDKKPLECKLYPAGPGAVLHFTDPAEDELRDKAAPPKR